MPGFKDDVEADLGSLLSADETALMQQMSIRLREAVEDVDSVARLDGLRTATSHDQGLDLLQAAERVFRRLNRELHRLFCGSDSDDRDDRNRIRDALGMGDLVLASAISHVLVGSFGLAPVIATVAAALLVKRVFQPTAEELCAHWAAKLD